MFRYGPSFKRKTNARFETYDLELVDFDTLHDFLSVFITYPPSPPRHLFSFTKRRGVNAKVLDFAQNFTTPTAILSRANTSSCVNSNTSSSPTSGIHMEGAMKRTDKKSSSVSKSTNWTALIRNPVSVFYSSECFTRKL